MTLTSRWSSVYLLGLEFRVVLIPATPSSLPSAVQLSSRLEERKNMIGQGFRMALELWIQVWCADWTASGQVLRLASVQ